MAAEFVLTAEAGEDVDAAYSWYERQRAGLGEEFLSCLEVCIQRICRNPELYPPVYKSYRRALVRRFPYAIFYEYASPQATIYAIVHTARDPEKWRQRLPT
jgi:plasmid stabilization system protein ParE